MFPLGDLGMGLGLVLGVGLGLGSVSGLGLNFGVFGITSPFLRGAKLSGWP